MFFNVSLQPMNGQQCHLHTGLSCQITPETQATSPLGCPPLALPALGLYSVLRLSAADRDARGHRDGGEVGLACCSPAARGAQGLHCNVKSSSLLCSPLATSRGPPTGWGRHSPGHRRVTFPCCAKYHWPGGGEALKKETLCSAWKDK